MGEEIHTAVLSICSQVDDVIDVNMTWLVASSSSLLSEGAVVFLVVPGSGPNGLEKKKKKKEINVFFELFQELNPIP